MIEYYIVTNDIIITNVVKYYASNRIYATAVRFQIDIFVFYLNLLLFTLKMRLTCNIYVLSFFFTFSKSEKYYIILMLKSFFICISSSLKWKRTKIVSFIHLWLNYLRFFLYISLKVFNKKQFWKKSLKKFLNIKWVENRVKRKRT